MTDNDKLTVWTIYKSPADFPGKWVRRGWDIPGGPRAEHTVADDLEGARFGLPEGLVRIPRQSNDDPAIYEVWI